MLDLSVTAMQKLVYCEFAKLRASSVFAPYVLSRIRALRALRAFVPYLPSRLTRLRVLRALRVLLRRLIYALSVSSLLVLLALPTSLAHRISAP